MGHYHRTLVLINPMIRLAVLLLAGLLTVPAAAELPLDELRLAEGFRIELFARVPGARSLRVGRDQLFVGTRAASVYAVDLETRTVSEVLTGLKAPNGIALDQDFLYVAEQHRIVRYRRASLGRAEPEILFTGLPDNSWHGWRYMTMGPDGQLYIAIGAPCNICRPKGYEGTIVTLEAGGGTPKIFAQGVRNSVGMDFHPATGELHFTDNGADHMGDDLPPDELNRAPRRGLHFGFPFHGGGSARTSQFAREPVPAGAVGPEIAFGAHVAALGIHFYRGRQFPGPYRGDAFVAQHGSWNRGVPDGYRVVRVRLTDDGRAEGYGPFIEGWLRDGKAWGRPVDIAELPDGSLLVSDDRAGAVYRISHDGR